MYLRRIAGCSAAAILASMLVSAIPASADDYAMESPAASGFRLGIGGAVGFRPKYEGSDEYEVIGFPLIFPKFGADGDEPGRVKFRGIDDVRYALFRYDWFEAGPLAGYNFGRDQDDARILRGLGDVDGGIVVGGYVGVRIWDVLFDASYNDQVSGDDTGYQLRFGAEVQEYVAPGVRLTGRVGTTYASDDYIDAYFSITPAQSAASVAGLPVYNGSSGIKDVHVALGAKIDLDDKWSLLMGLKYSRLVGDAADSPITQSEDQLSGSIGVSYLVDWGAY